VVDTHAHLGLCKAEVDEVVSAARHAGVRRILTIGLGEETNREAIAHAERFEDVYASVGRHPNSSEGFDDSAAADLSELAGHERVRAIGETGLDLFREGAPIDDQRRAFHAQIEVAREHDKPLVIHMRDAQNHEEASTETFETLAQRADGVTVILHCFSASPARAAEAGTRGWYCSFAGNVTYPKNEDLREAARAVPDELILAETDSPYLAPQPVRGKPNQPANVVATAAVLAAERGVEPAELEATVEANAAAVFGW
jgi:TatD DNase family protein